HEDADVAAHEPGGDAGNRPGHRPHLAAGGHGGACPHRRRSPAQVLPRRNLPDRRAMTITERLFGLAGKVALVTGAGSGIGQAIALALAEAGAAVVLVGRRRQPLEETASRVAASGGRAAALPCDLAEHEALLQCAT